jgi:hypothetical protein
MKEVKEVIGTKPPCMRCQAAKKAVEKAAEKLKQAGIRMNVSLLQLIKETR